MSPVEAIMIILFEMHARSSGKTFNLRKRVIRVVYIVVILILNIPNLVNDIDGLGVGRRIILKR